MPGVTKEQIRQAREADLFAYLERHERGVLKRDGPNYRHREHDSLVYVTAKNYWYWNSRGKRINALDYLMEIRGYGLVEAVNALAGPAMQYSFPSRSYQDHAAARQATIVFSIAKTAGPVNGQDERRISCAAVDSPACLC